MKMKFIYTIIFVFFSLNINAEKIKPGYIITNTGDTISGHIKIQPDYKLYQECTFIKDNKETIFEPNAIKSYSINNERYFKSGILNNSFVELLVTGDIFLYKKQNIFFIVKNGKVHKLQKNKEVEESGITKFREDNRWKNIFIYLINDKLKNQINPKKIIFSEKFFTNFVQKYNSHFNEDVIEIKRNIPWNKYSIGFSTGLSNTNFGVKRGSNGGNFGHSKVLLDPHNFNTYSPYIGIVSEISWPRISNKIELQLGIEYSKASISNSVESYKDPYLTTIYHYLAEINKLSIPISVMYNVNILKKHRFYFKTGTVIDYNFQSEFDITYEKRYLKTIQLYRYGDLTTSKVVLGITGGLGFKIDSKRFTGRIELNYNALISNIIAESVFKIREQRLAFGIIISYKN